MIRDIMLNNIIFERRFYQMKKEIKSFVLGAVFASLLVSALPTMAEKFSKTAELFYNNIKVVIDGKRADLKDVNGNVVDPFIIDGTTYLPVRAVANALDKAVSWDGATQTVYLGKNEEIEQPSVWLKDLETFTGEAVAKSANEIEFGGSDYNNTLTANTGDVYQNYLYPNKYGSPSYVQDADISYLLNYKYSRFKGTFYLAKGHKDYEYWNRVVIYGDDKVIYTSDEITTGDKPVSIDIDVSNIGTLKFVYQSKRYDEDEWRSKTSANGQYDDWGFIKATPIGNAGLYE